ncbi:MAG: hypothetical protein Q8N06_08520 [Hydrogenophaga sp.]|nr:hypothetical protein [Hydrogenophaga sp.]
MSKTIRPIWLRLATALLICSTILIACAIGPEKPKIYSYQINWNVATDAPVYGKPEVKVLDFAYGVTDQFDIIPDKWMRNSFRADGCCDVVPMGINAPRGDYLYFKWRLLATGQVFEDRVDLSKRLPQDMNNRGLHIAIFGSQLYVYLFPPRRTKELNRLDIVTPGSAPTRVLGESYQDTLRESAYARQYQIYP